MFAQFESIQKYHRNSARNVESYYHFPHICLVFESKFSQLLALKVWKTVDI